MTGKQEHLRQNNIFVLITVKGGIVDQVSFFNESEQALLALAAFVKKMNIENDDAVVYNQKGFFANAKDFLDDNDQFVINSYIFGRK